MAVKQQATSTRSWLSLDTRKQEHLLLDNNQERRSTLSGNSAGTTTDPPPQSSVSHNLHARRRYVIRGRVIGSLQHRCVFLGIPFVTLTTHQGHSIAHHSQQGAEPVRSTLLRKVKGIYRRCNQGEEFTCKNTFPHMPKKAQPTTSGRRDCRVHNM